MTFKRFLNGMGDKRIKNEIKNIARFSLIIN